jgi:hypothetical protein
MYLRQAGLTRNPTFLYLYSVPCRGQDAVSESPLERKYSRCRPDVWTMRQVMTIKFKELKDTSARMRALVKRTLGADSNSRTSFDELGVAGLDWNSFIEEYNNEFRIELKGLNYSDYFADGISDLSFNDLLLFPYRLSRRIIFKLTGQRGRINQKSNLTIGDLILSVHAGRFVKREDVEIRLEKTYGLQQNVSAMVP